MSETDVNQPMVRAIGRTLNRIDMKAANADVSAEEIKTAWQANRVDYMKRSRQLLNALEKQGFTITAPEAVSEEA